MTLRTQSWKNILTLSHQWVFAKFISYHLRCSTSFCYLTLLLTSAIFYNFPLKSCISKTLEKHQILCQNITSKNISKLQYQWYFYLFSFLWLQTKRTVLKLYSGTKKRITEEHGSDGMVLGARLQMPQPRWFKSRCQRSSWTAKNFTSKRQTFLQVTTNMQRTGPTYYELYLEKF